MSPRATNWAKRQRTGNPAAKAVLLAIADETASNGISAPLTYGDIAFEAEVSPETARRWVKKMEDDGLMVRLESAGKANEFRLMMGDEAATHGKSDDEIRRATPPQIHPGSPPTDSPRVTPPQTEGGTSYEEDSNPQTPFQKGVLVSEEDLAERVRAVLDVHPCKSTRRDELKTLVAALTDEEHALLVAACAGYAVECARHKRKSPMDPARFARKPENWTDYAALAPKPAPEKIFIERGTPEYAGLCVLRAISLGADNWPPPKAPQGMAQVQGREGTLVDETVDAAVLAGLAPFASEHGRPDFDRWQAIRADTKQFYAWSDRAVRAGFGPIEPQIHDFGGPSEKRVVFGKELDLPDRHSGILAPAEWPPRLTGDGPPDDGADDTGESGEAITDHGQAPPVDGETESLRDADAHDEDANMEAAE